LRPIPKNEWTFRTNGGSQGWDGIQPITNVFNEFYAWANRDGDVARVPVPGTLALLRLGLGLIGISRALGKAGGGRPTIKR
jgi:hypothetical protein